MARRLIIVLFAILLRRIRRTLI